MPEEVRCPSCEAKLRVPDNLLGASVKCPKCATTFTAEVEAPAGPEDGIVSEPVPSARTRRALPPEYAEDEGPPPADEFEDDELPRRRGRRIGRRTAEAESAVAGPAIALMVVSGLAIALCLLSLAINVLGAGVAAAGPGGRAQQGDLAVQAVSGIGSAVFALCYWSIVMVGAVKMKSLSSYGLAMTACILAMIPCSACCILGLPFGIWGLVVLNKPEVKDAFNR